MSASWTGPEDWWQHGLWCVGGLALAVPFVVSNVRSDFMGILTDHRLMFLASFAAYFLFGAGMLAFGQDGPIEAALRYYPLTANDALRVDAVNALGFGIALMTASVSRARFLGSQASRAAAGLAGVPAHVVIPAFLVIGFGASIYVLSFDLGFRHGLVPGVVRNVSNLSIVAVFLAAASAAKHEGVLRAIAVAVAALLSVLGALQFNKTGVLLPVASLVAGLTARFGPRRVMPLGLGVLIIGFLTLGDLAAYGRRTVGYKTAAGLAERWQVLLSGWEDARDLGESERYSPWARLCYTPPQAAALDFWDTGQGGDGFQLMPWVFVPRALAEEKPEITRTGREFHQRITGADTSSTGMGIFVSGYYAGGWWGLWAASALCGWILAQTSAIARAVMATRVLLFVPLALLGVHMAFRIDGDFVSDYVGTFVFILYPVIAMSVVFSSRFHRTPCSQHDQARLSRR